MPNWCTNSIEIGHEDKQVLSEMVRKMAKDGICMTVLPLEPWTYNEAVRKWGTKWDLTIDNETDAWTDDFWEDEGAHWVGTFANSAWSPPVEIYDELVKQGFRVKAWWWEPGCEIIGQYETSVGEDGDVESVIDEWVDLNEFRAIMGEDYVNSELRGYIEEDIEMWECN